LGSLSISEDGLKFFSEQSVSWLALRFGFALGKRMRAGRRGRFGGIPSHRSLRSRLRRSGRKWGLKDCPLLTRGVLWDVPLLTRGVLCGGLNVEVAVLM
jgi:hypothetical protein